MNFTEEELLVIESTLVTVMKKYNEYIIKGYHFTKFEKEMFETMKGILSKLEDMED